MPESMYREEEHLEIPEDPSYPGLIQKYPGVCGSNCTLYTKQTEIIGLCARCGTVSKGDSCKLEEIAMRGD